MTALSWIDDCLDRRGLTRTDPVEEVRVRAWSTVWRVPAGAGSLWFKETAPALGHEAALTDALTRWRPAHLPDVLAADHQRHWLLLADAGVVLRSQLPSARGLRLWEEAMTLHAELQIELLGRVSDFVALGVWDRRPSGLASELATLLSSPPEGLSEDELRRLHDALPALSRPDDALPAALYHDDFHDGNLFVAGEDHLTLADWGDAAVGHPFCPLTVALRSAAYRLETTPDDPRVLRLRDAYLEPWTRFAPRAALLAALPAADRRGRLSRALTWHRVLAPLSDPERAEYAEAVPGWLQEFLG